MNKISYISILNRKSSKVKGYSLNYTILLFVLFISILSSFISFNYFYNTRQNLRVRQLELINHCKSGISFLLATKSSAAEQKFDSIIMVGNSIDSIYIQSSAWGGFTLLKSHVDWKNHSMKKAGLAGNLMLCDTSDILNLADKSRPLSLCMDTDLMGYISIPRAGLKYEMMNGKNFSGHMVPELKIKVSSDTLPELLPYYDSLSIVFLTERLIENNKSNSIDYGIPFDSLYNSFWDATKIIYVEEELLTYDHLSGQIVVFADSLLIVPSDCQLNDVILIAQNIRFEEGFSGRIQCFVTHKIELEKQVKLLFPSGLYMVQKDHSVYDSTDVTDKNITISKGSRVEGIVFSNYPDSYKKQFDLKLTIDELAEIRGLVFWPGSIELKGVVNGQVHSHEFTYRTPTGYYRNYIVNGSIKRTHNLVGNFIPGCFDSNRSGGILSWLY